MVKLRMVVVACVAAAMAAGCGGSKALKGGELAQTIQTQENQGSYIEVIGMGAADPKLASVTQRRITSRNAAVVDAQYQLVAKVKGVTVEGGITVEKAMETDSKITTRVNDMVKGAELVKTEWTNDDGCVATVRLSKAIIEKELGLKIQ